MTDFRVVCSRCLCDQPYILGGIRCTNCGCPVRAGNDPSAHDEEPREASKSSGVDATTAWWLGVAAGVIIGALLIIWAVSS